MRPVQLHIEGLACFKDKQQLDFGELELFAISGPTGAGKSTLLDAIIFALYGEVPRVDNRSRTEMISAGRDRLSVRLDFDVGPERYRIARVLRRSNGQQQVGLEKLGGGGSAKSLASGVREATEHVTRILGLGADAFMQAVVLPQGEFARFLKAPPSERRKMLCALLKLDVYDRMREEAQRRASARRGQVESLRQRLDGEYGGVDEGAVAALEAEHAAVAGALDEAKARRDEAQAELVRLRGRHARTKELAQAEQRRQALEAEAEGARRDRARLDAAARAAAVIPALDAAARAAEGAGAAETAAAAARARCDDARRAYEETAAALAAATAAAAEIGAIRERIARLQQVSGRLPERDRLRDSVARQARALDVLEKEAAALEGQAEAARAAQARHLAAAEAARRAVEAAAGREAEAEAIEEMRQRLARLHRAAGQLSERAQLEAAIARQAAVRRELEAELAVLASAIEAARAAQAKQRAAAEEARRAIEESAHDAELDALLERLRPRAIQHGADRKGAATAEAEVVQQRATVDEFDRELRPVQEETEAARQLVEDALREAGAAEAARRLAEGLDYASHLRATLSPGEPCPVCEQVVARPPLVGARPALARARAALEEARAWQADAEARARKIDANLAKAQAKLEAERQRLAELEARGSRLAETVAAGDDELRRALGAHAPRRRKAGPPIDPTGLRPAPRAEPAGSPPRDSLTLIEAWIEAQIEAVARSRRASEEARARLTAAERALEKLEADAASARDRRGDKEALMQRLGEERAASDQRLAALRREIEAVAGSGDPAAEAAALDARLRTLEAARARRADAERGLARARAEEAIARGKLEEQQRSRQQLEEALAQGRARLAELEAEIADLAGNLAPAAAIEAANRRIERLELDVRNADEAARAARTRLLGAEAELRHRAEAAGAARGAAAELAARCTDALAAAGFSDERAARAAVLERAAASQLDARVRRHAQDLHAALERVAALEAELAGERVSDEALAAAAGRAAELTAAVEARVRDATRLAEQLRQARERLERSKVLRAQLAEEERALRLFGGLAGDLRSDKFQAYVLAEVFTELVRGASTRLLALTRDRYSLQFADGEIVVVDHDNAGETRISDTLSGGETFLASLALALELSEQVQRAAGAVRLDSLFIDEGFGTLDPDTLEKVSEAIHGLGVGGRMVGIITHIPELRDEFAQQVIVTKHAGFSTVKVHGLPAAAPGG